MRWFKHMSNSLNDPFVVDLITKFGSDGYLVWFGTLEFLALDDALDHKENFSWTYITRAFYLKKSQIKPIYDFIAKENKIKIAYLDDEDKVSIFCPKLKEYRDEYAEKKEAKKRKTKSGQCRDNIPPDTDTDTDTEADTDTNKEKKFTPYGYFLDTYKAIKGVAWVGDAGRAGKKLKELLTQITVDEYREILPRYFAMTDKWVVDHGYDVERLVEKINVLRCPAPVDPKDLPLRFVKKKDGKHYILNNDDDNYPYPFEAYERIRKQQYGQLKLWEER